MAGTGKRRPFFERLKSSLEEGIEFAQGKQKLRTTVLPNPPPAVRANDIRELRHRLELSQLTFAQMLNVSVKTLQSWEQGTRRPAKGTLRLLQVFRERPAVIYEVTGVPRQAI
jgi:putative transcriptional regulator